MSVRLKQFKAWIDGLTLKVRALYYCSLDERMPLLAKAVAVAVVAYALSPVDLIPDFIPVLGLLDDLVILPAGLWLAIRLVPDELWAQSLLQARNELPELRSARVAGLVIIGFWVLLILVAGYQLTNLTIDWQWLRWVSE